MPSTISIARVLLSSSSRARVVRPRPHASTQPCRSCCSRGPYHLSGGVVGAALAGIRRQRPSISVSSFLERFYSQTPKLSASSASSDDELVSILDDLSILDQIPLEDVRNFCFIAHVDHGKSSLASRVLELTGNLGADAQRVAYGHTRTSNSSENAAQEKTNSNNAPTDKKGKEKIEALDTLSVEQERGITVKATAASMLYRHPSAIGPSGCLLLNMVDTPGHADFGSEVSRSLANVDGAVLLFDAAQGVQAQTLSVHEKATSMSLNIIPALTKVDLPAARPVDIALAVSELFGYDPDAVLLSSARSRIGIADVMEAVCTRVPAPVALADDDGMTLRAKVVDSWFENLRGVVCLVQVLSGSLKENDRISVLDLEAAPGDSDTDNGRPRAKYGKETFSVQENGIITPNRIRTGILSRGQMGYVIAGLRDPRQAKPGSLLVRSTDLPAVAEMDMPKASSLAATKSVLYASVHPMEAGGFDELAAAVDRLALNDTGLEVQKTSGASNQSDGGPFLGPGLRVGFQGLLHVEVFRQRLLDEFDLEAIVTPPKVPYTIRYLTSTKYKRPDDAPTEETIEDLNLWPPHGARFKILEPIVKVSIIAPVDYAGNIMDLIKRRRGQDISTTTIDETTWLFSSNMPWAEVVSDFYDELKSTSAGFASFDTSETDPPVQESSLCKVDIMLNSEIVEPMAFVSHKDSVQRAARIVCKKLQANLPRQQFVTVIQAKAEGKIVASERIKAYRKDVLIKSGKVVGGGDITRKKKLLEKQKKGKKRMQASGRVQLSQEAFNAVISRS